MSPAPIELEGATVAELRQQLDQGSVTSIELVAAYTARIEAIDGDGPRLRSIITGNPDAEAMASAADSAIARGDARGPMHGIPVLVKDNIATGDAMATTAGSSALAGVRARHDAHLVGRLRAAGAVILGKTNLSEWANIRSTRSTSGWSAVGGLARNPYALDRCTSGSSSGSASAVAADLAVEAVGTETDGSITSPASVNGLVGLKPTVGLVSRHGVIPISPTQDTAGPMARCVADAAALLDALAGPDPADPATGGAPRRSGTFAGALEINALAGAQLGVLRGHFGSQPDVCGLAETALDVLRDAGAVLVDPVDCPDPGALEASELEVLLTELPEALGRWLAEFAPDAPVKSLAHVVAWNEAHRDEELSWFGQEHFKSALDKGPLSSDPYRRAWAECRRLARHQGLDPVLAADRLDALVVPTGGPAWLIDLVNGDHYTGSFTTLPAVAGYPHLTVPMGLVHGLPVGLSFVGPAWSDARLLGYGYAYEQRAQARRPPTFRPSADLDVGSG